MFVDSRKNSLLPILLQVILLTLLLFHFQFLFGKTRNYPLLIKNGHVYRFVHKNKCQNKYYLCQKSATKCPGSITVNPAGNVVRETAHTCSGFCKRELVERPVQAERININRVRSSITIAPRNQSRPEPNPLEERPVVVFEKLQNGTKPNFVFGKSKAHPGLRHNNNLYNFMYKNKSHNKYYLCKKASTEKCSGSLIISPDHAIVKQKPHTCSGFIKTERSWSWFSICKYACFW